MDAVPLAEVGAFVLGAVRQEAAVHLAESSDFVLGADRVEAALSPLALPLKLSLGDKTF